MEAHHWLGPALARGCWQAFIRESQGSSTGDARIAGHHNYSVFLRDDLLFSYFEYDSEIDIDARRRAMRASPVLEPWLSLMNACQQPLADAGPNEWWASMDEIYHLD